MELCKNHLDKYFILNDGIGRFIAKDSDFSTQFLFEYVTSLDGNDKNGKLNNTILLFGRFGKYGKCKYKGSENILKQISEGEALIRMI